MEFKDNNYLLEKTKELSSQIEEFAKKIDKQDDVFLELVKDTTEVENKMEYNKMKFISTIKKLENDGRNFVITLLFGVILFLGLLIRT